MFLNPELKLKSYQEMRQEMEALDRESERLKVEASQARVRSDTLREQSVEMRSVDEASSEALWQEAEDIRSQAQEMLRESVEKRIRAAEIKHRLEIHDQIEAVTDEAEMLWRGAIR